MYDFSLSLVVPVYNEEEIIEESITLFNHSLSQKVSNYEIIVVNDGSQDRTAEILENLCSTNEKVRVFHNSKNIGSGASLWRGFREATKDFIMSNFADRPFNMVDLGKIGEMVDLDCVDFIVCVRKDRSANSFYRRITSYINYILIRTLFCVKIADYQFVQIYKRSTLKDIMIESKETFVPPELMIKLVKKGCRYKEIKCMFEKRPGGKSKCGHPGKIMRSIKEIIWFWIKWHILQGKKRYEN